MTHIYVKERAFNFFLNEVQGMDYEQLCDLVLLPEETMEQFEEVISDDDKFEHRLEEVFNYRWDQMNEDDRTSYLDSLEWKRTLDRQVSDMKKNVLYPRR